MNEEPYPGLEVRIDHITKDESPKYFVPPTSNELPEVSRKAEIGLIKAPTDQVQELGFSENNDKQHSQRKWMLWGIVIALIIVATVVGGVVGGILSRHSKAPTPSPASTSSSGSSATSNATMSGTAAPATSHPYPTAVTWGYPHLEVFVLDSGVYPEWKYKNSSTSGLAGWAPNNDTFKLLGGASAPFQYGVVAAARDTQNVDIFATGSDFGLYHKYHSTDMKWGPSDTSWEGLGGILSSAPSVVSWDSMRLDIFGIGESPTYGLFQMTWDENGWSGWVGHPSQIMSTFAPGIVSWTPGRLDVFALGENDKSLYYRYYDKSQWQPANSFINLGGYGTSRPVAMSIGMGRIDVFLRGGDAGLWHKYCTNTTWSNWLPISEGASIQTEPSMVSMNSESIDIFAWAADSSLVHKKLNVANGTWTPVTGFEKLCDGLRGPPTAISDNAGNIHVFAYLQTGNLGHLTWNGTLQSWSLSQGMELLGVGNWS